MKAHTIGLASLFVLAAFTAVHGQSREAVQAAQANPKWYYDLNRLAEEKKWDEAIAFVRGVVDQEPPAPDAERLLHHFAWLRAHKSQREDALEFYQLAIDKFPESPLRARALCGIAEIYAHRRPVDRESERQLREQVIGTYEQAFAIAFEARDSGSDVELPSLAHEKLAEHYLAAAEWEKALPVLQSWNPTSWCGTCYGQMQMTREMGIVLCLANLGRFDEAIVYAWRDVTPESSLQTSSFGTFVLMRLYSEAGQFSDLEQQVEDYLAAGWRAFPERRSAIAYGSACLLETMERARSRTLTKPVSLLRAPLDSMSHRNPAEAQLARWLVIRGGDQSIPQLQHAALASGKVDLQMVEVLAAIDTEAARESLVRLGAASHTSVMQSMCGLIRSRVRDPEPLIESIAAQVSESDKQVTKQRYYAPATIAFRLSLPWKPPARGSLPKTFPQQVFAKIENVEGK
jgi:tetratricopeptide (TPR) repeat protein